MSTRLLETPDFIRKRGQYGVWNHFVGAPASWPNDNWVVTATDSGTATVSDGVKGVLAMAPSDGSVADNDEIYIQSKELFKFAADKPAIFETLLQFTEANTDDANIMAGFMDAPTANCIQDNGAGPKASYSGAVFFKVDGGTTWNAETSIAGSQVTTELTAANSLDKTLHTAGGSAYQRLRIEYNPINATVGDVDFFIDGVHVAKHTVTFASATEMAAMAGAKNGAANNEGLNLDYIGAEQLS